MADAVAALRGGSASERSARPSFSARAEGPLRIPLQPDQQEDLAARAFHLLTTEGAAQAPRSLARPVSKKRIQTALASYQEALEEDMNDPDSLVAHGQQWPA